MPWGWAPRQETRAQSHAEPSSTTPWKEQEAQVLKRLLVSDEGRFKTGDILGSEAKLVYLQKQVQAGVREEAEADLVHGFRAWLQGTHAENKPGRTDKYENKPDGRPHRRKMDGARYDTEDTDWQSTPWGDAQLTHLPGVREWLREEAIAADKADLEMQLLAEYGPHDVESAWRYYKHWVLKRPISYPHAHAQSSSEPEAWHGPGMASDAHPRGFAPRRSTHFDALPPPSKPKYDRGEGELWGGELFAGFTDDSPAAAPSSLARVQEQPKPEAARRQEVLAALQALARVQEQPKPEAARRQEVLAALQARIDERQRGQLRTPNRAPNTAPAPRRSQRDIHEPNRYGWS
jgi:hypothetical protein